MPPDDVRSLAAQIAALHAKLDAVLQGKHDDNGHWHPGMSPTVQDHTRRLVALESAQADAETRQLNWRHAIGLSMAGGVVTQALAWVLDHVK